MKQKIFAEWEESKIKKLFKMVEVQKEKGVALTKIFNLYAQEENRKPNSVRNYYYMEVERLTEDKNRCKKLNIDISKHKTMQISTFSKEDTKTLISKIDFLKNKGYSIRKACLELANYDISLMVRMQNKYRSVTKYNKDNNNSKNEENSKILKMPIQNKLTDSDINNLFMGLVNLVKKNAQNESERTFKDKLERANDSLRTTLVELANKENEIKKYREQFKLLKQNENTLKEQILKLKCKNAEIITAKQSKEKLEKLEQFLPKLNRKKQTN